MHYSTASAILNYLTFLCCPCGLPPTPYISPLTWLTFYFLFLLLTLLTSYILNLAAAVAFIMHLTYCHLRGLHLTSYPYILLTWLMKDLSPLALGAMVSFGPVVAVCALSRQTTCKRSVEDSQGYRRDRTRLSAPSLPGHLLPCPMPPAPLPLWSPANNLPWYLSPFPALVVRIGW